MNKTHTDVVGKYAEKAMFLHSRQLDEKHYPFITKLTDDEYTSFRNAIRTTLQSQADKYEREKGEERKRIWQKVYDYADTEADGEVWLHASQIIRRAKEDGVDLSDKES